MGKKNKIRSSLPAVEQPAPGPQRRGIGAVFDEFKRLSLGGKVLLFILLASHLPLLNLMLNSLPLNFDVCTPPYQHMGMIARIVDGLPLYTGPSTEHSVVTYTPLYWVIVGLLAKIFGLSFTLARIVTLASSALMWFSVAAFVWTNTARNLVLSVAAPAILFASSVVIGNWALDIHVNALHYALCAAGFLCLRDPLTNRRVVASAILLSLCVLAKQTGFAYVAAAGFSVLMIAPKRAPLFAIVSAGIIGVSFFALQHTSHGQFWNQIGPANAKLPWTGQRIIDEILMQSFGIYAGIMLLMTIVNLIFDWTPNIFLLARKPHYVFLASGVIVACIAHPKYGSGNTHDVVALAGLCVCGCIGLHRLMQKSRPRTRASLAILPIVQIAIILFAGRTRWAAFTATDADKITYARIAHYFQTGRTTLFATPYIQRSFNQPSLGIPDDEFSKWRNGRLDYSALPDFYVKPYRDEAFDYIIIADYFDPGHPVCQALMQHYPLVIEKIPAHAPFETYLRHEMFVVIPRRSVPGGPAAQALRPHN